jgi:hypothetical protein
MFPVGISAGKNGLLADRTQAPALNKGAFMAKKNPTCELSQRRIWMAWIF